jgi:hypothetical protein
VLGLLSAVGVLELLPVMLLLLGGDCDMAVVLPWEFCVVLDVSVLAVVTAPTGKTLSWNPHALEISAIAMDLSTAQRSFKHPPLGVRRSYAEHVLLPTDFKMSDSF